MNPIVAVHRDREGNAQAARASDVVAGVPVRIAASTGRLRSIQPRRQEGGDAGAAKRINRERP